MGKQRKVSLGRAIIDLCLEQDTQIENSLFKEAAANPFMLGILWVQLAEQEWRYAMTSKPQRALRKMLWTHASQIRTFIRKELGDAEFDRVYRAEHVENEAVYSTVLWDHNVPMFDDEGKALDKKKAVGRALSLGPEQS